MRPRDGEEGPPRRAPRSLDDRPPPRRQERSLDAGDRPPRRAPDAPDRPPPKGMVRYRIAVGHDHGVQPGNIVGAIANEAQISSEHIGRINIYDGYTTVDLPEGMPSETFKQLQKAWVCGQKLGIRVESGGSGGEADQEEPPAKPRPKKLLSLGDKRGKLGKREMGGKPPPKKHGKGPIRPKRK
jgi:ATP-dependent RNA helicase DeaD